MLPLDLPHDDPDATRRRGFYNDSPVTRLLTRGVCRLLSDMGYGPVTEFRLPNGRRISIDSSARFRQPLQLADSGT